MQLKKTNASENETRNRHSPSQTHFTLSSQANTKNLPPNTERRPGMNFSCSAKSQ
jgi:hypothetical protein